ncbi:MAG: lysostaphin resistance A-like protein [Caulobacteraceae bacterium]
MTSASVGIGRRARSAILAIVGLLIAIGIPELLVGLNHGAAIPAAPSGFAVHEAPWWILIAIVLAWGRLVEMKPSSSLGLRRPTWKSVAIAIAAAIVMLAITLVCYSVVFPALRLAVPAGAQQSILRLPFAERLEIVVRAAVCEEIIYRGYTISRVASLTGSRVLAVIASIAAFSAAHLSYWGPAQLIPVAIIGLVLALLWLWRRDLPCNMIAHFLTDGTGFLLR